MPNARNIKPGMAFVKNHKCKLLLSIVCLLLAGELFARLILGLGTPPLSVSHPRIEYMFKPNQNVYRFGNHFATNAFGMRTENFAVKKSEKQYRIMVFGDSVVNGGNITDQAELATSILKKRLSEQSQFEIVVGNISAGSWGPGNWLAYVEDFGFFEPDAIILVISSHDYVDSPTFAPLNEHTHPTKAPISALVEGLTRYLPRYLPKKEKLPEENAVRDSRQALSDLNQFLQLAIKNTPKVFVFQHWEKVELGANSADIGNFRIRELCEKLNLVPISLAPYFVAALDAGRNPYSDNIHPNQIGQEIMAAVFLEKIAQGL